MINRRTAMTGDEIPLGLSMTLAQYPYMYRDLRRLTAAQRKALAGISSKDMPRIDSTDEPYVPAYIRDDINSIYL